MMSRIVSLLHPDAKIPIKKYDTDAGYDCFLIEDLIVPPKCMTRFPLGLAIQIKRGEMLSIKSRSSVKMKGLSCADNVCDTGYTGELFAFIVNHNEHAVTFKKGQRVVQLVFYTINANEVLNQGILEKTPRSESGFGSTGL